MKRRLRTRWQTSQVLKVSIDVRAHGTERGPPVRRERVVGTRGDRTEESSGEDRRTGHHERGPEEENDYGEEQCGPGRRGDGQQNLAGRRSKNESGGKMGSEVGEAPKHRGWRLDRRRGGGWDERRSQGPRQPEVSMRSRSRDGGKGVVTPSEADTVGPGWDASPARMPVKPVCQRTRIRKHVAVAPNTKMKGARERARDWPETVKEGAPPLYNPRTKERSRKNKRAMKGTPMNMIRASAKVRPGD